jgi:hypothetical protein
MPPIQRFTNEQVINAYRNTGSVWKAGKELGILGQSVWERLRRMDYPMGNQKWTAAERAELEGLVRTGISLGEIGRRLGRPYAGTAIKISRWKLRPQWRYSHPRKPKRGSGANKAKATKWKRIFERDHTPLRQLARKESVHPSSIGWAMEYYFPGWWATYKASQSDLKPRPCIGCHREFIPSTGKQRYCSARCMNTSHRDQEYFGGNRNNTIGLAEQTCQLCQRVCLKHLSSHHVLGKENDAKNEHLIALCRGCHDLVTRLSARPWMEDSDKASDLLALVLARRGKLNTFVCLEYDTWSEHDIAERLEAEQELSAKSPIAGASQDAHDTPGVTVTVRRIPVDGGKA